MSKTSYGRVTNRNRRRIQEAFAELLSEYGSMKLITVSALAERADITRGTFYNYYNNLAEVAAELEGEIENQLFAGYSEIASFEDFEQYLDEVFAFMEQRGEIYSELLSSCDTHGFLSQLEAEISERALEIMANNGIKSQEAELELLFLINGAMTLLRKYYLHETDLTLEQIRGFLKKKLRWLFKNFITPQNLV